MNIARKNARLVLENSTLDEFTDLVTQARLTNRQKYILEQSLNRFNYQIAMKMDISPETVKNDLRKAYDKISKVLLL